MDSNDARLSDKAPKTDSESRLSLLKLIAASVIFGTIGFFRKGIPLSSAALACFRGLSGAVFLLLYARFRLLKLFRGIRVGQCLALAGTGAVMGVNWILLFEAYRYIPVSQATLCYYMQPSIVMLLSPLILKERMTAKSAVCILLSALGMVLVSGVAGTAPPEGEALLGIVLGLGAACLYAAVIFLNKTLTGIGIYEKTILQLAGAAGILLPYLIFAERPDLSRLEPVSILLLLTVGLVHTGLAYVLYFGSMDALKARTIALVSYLDPISALLLSALLFGERLTYGELCGAFLILVSAAAAELSFPKRAGRDHDSAG